AGVFDTPQCVVQLEPGAGIISLAPPDSSDRNDATSFAFTTPPKVKPGDLVRVEPAKREGAPEPTFTVVERAAKKCSAFVGRGRASSHQHP
ncbi:MAG: hypothetical protein ACHQNA_03450, partial [Acidimicrobiales bacterium]